MGPAELNAIFAFLGVVVAVATGWLSQQARRKQREARERAMEREAIQSRVSEQLDVVVGKLDEQRGDISSIREDVTELKARVAVHDDRWQRPHLYPVSEGRDIV